MNRRESSDGDGPGAGWTRRTERTRPRRRRVVNVGRSLETEALEVRALLSGQTVQLIQDVNTVETHPSDLTPAGSNLFYQVEDSSGSGSELVVTNASGTQVLKDFGSSTISQPTGVGTRVFFLSGSATSPALWTSDGTAGGTAQVTLTGITPSSISGLTSLGSTAIFETQTGSGSTADYRLYAAGAVNPAATMIQDFHNTSFTVNATIGGTAYLSVGGDLWTTDGTAANTVELKDSSSQPIPTPTNLFAFQGQTYYETVSSGSTVFGTLGTGGETPLINLTNVAFAPVADGSMFFFTTTISSSYYSATELWASNGTQAGTQMVKDFSSISRTSGPAYPVSINGSLYFTVAGTDGLAQLWTSNGTSAGTSLVKDLGVTASYGYSHGNYSVGINNTLVAVGGTLYFAADDSTHGAELWSDTVATGTTQLVNDINPGQGGSDPHDLVDWNGRLAFAANDGSSPLSSQLWTSGGTAGSTTKAASFSPGATESAVTGTSSSSRIVLGSELLLALNDGVRGTSLWATNGTAAGTQFLAAVDPTNFAILNGTAYFLGSSAGSPFALWMTNGTASGTTRVMDLSSDGRIGSYFFFNEEQLAASGGKLYFTTSDGNGGVDLWASNGTAGGTSVIRDFAATPVGSSAIASVTDMTPFGGNLAFIANGGTSGTQVWITNGTTGGTVPLTSLSDAGGAGGTVVAPSSLTVIGGSLDFIAGTPSGAAGAAGLWSSDGTEANTSEFFDFPTLSQPGASPATAAEVTVVGSSLFFALDYTYTSGGTVNDDQLWTSNGTAGGTVQVTAPASGSFIGLGDFMALGNQLVFQAEESSGATGIWASNGTAGGTTELKVLDPTAGAQGIYASSNSIISNGVLYFAANDGTHGAELWQSDGTPAGTSLLADIDPGAAGSDPAPLAVVNDHAVLAANDGTHGSELMTLVPVPFLPPYVAAIPTQSATIGQTFGLDVGAYASDPNTPALPITFSLGAGAPSGARIDPSTGVFVWTPSAGQPTGATTITIDVSDNQSPPHTTVATFTVDVSPAPAAPPVLRAVSQAASANVGQEFTFDVSSLASDPNTPPLPLTYSIAPAPPAGVSINPTTGLLSWNVPATQRIGNYPVTVIASDNSSPPKTASETLTIAVADPGPPPTVSTPVVSTKKGLTITFTFSQPVDPATAANVSNYILTMPSKKRASKKKPAPPPTVIHMSVSYNQATNQVTLKAKKPKAGTVLTLTVVGSGANGIAKLTGLQLAGNGSQSGTNYVATIRGKRLTPTAAVSANTVVVRTAKVSVPHGPGGPLALLSHRRVRSSTG